MAKLMKCCFLFSQRGDKRIMIFFLFLNYQSIDMAKAIQELVDWKQLGLTDLRVLEAERRNPPMNEADQGNSVEEAIDIVERWLGFLDPVTEVMPLSAAVLDSINVERDKIEHIVEKRRDARERYVNLAIDTLSDPFEVWKTAYDDGQVRYIFIGAYAQKHQMLVVVAPWNGKVLWNFMQTYPKELNKHRRGDLLYQKL